MLVMMASFRVTASRCMRQGDRRTFSLVLPAGPLEEAAALLKHHCFGVLVGRATSWMRQLSLPLPSHTGGLRRLKLCSRLLLALLRCTLVARLMGNV